MRRTSRAIVVLLAASIVPIAAVAATPGSSSDRAALKASAFVAWKKAGCTSADHWLGGNVRPLQIRAVRVSRADRRFAEVVVADNGCLFNLGWLFRRTAVHGARWRMLTPIADSAQLCSSYRKLAPERVLAEFGIHGQQAASGGFGRC